MLDSNNTYSINSRCFPGIYEVPHQNRLIWVATVPQGRAAIELRESCVRPMMACEVLTHETFAVGMRTHVVMPVWEDSPSGFFPGRCGMLIRRGIGLYLRANAPSGYAVDLRLVGFKFDESKRYSEAYLNWGLANVLSRREEIVFKAPGLIKPVRFDDPEVWQLDRRMRHRTRNPDLTPKSGANAPSNGR